MYAAPNEMGQRNRLFDDLPIPEYRARVDVVAVAVHGVRAVALYGVDGGAVAGLHDANMI